MKQKKQYTDFSAEELAHAIELLVAPEDLKHPDVMIAVLQALSYTPEEVAEQLASGEQLDAGPAVLFSAI